MASAVPRIWEWLLGSFSIWGSWRCVLFGDFEWLKQISAKFTHACRDSIFNCTWWCPSFITSKLVDLYNWRRHLDLVKNRYTFFLLFVFWFGFSFLLPLFLLLPLTLLLFVCSFLSPIPPAAGRYLVNPPSRFHDASAAHVFQSILNDIIWMICTLYVCLALLRWLPNLFVELIFEESFGVETRLITNHIKLHNIRWTESRTRLRCMKPYELWDKLQRFGKPSDRGSLSINGTCLMFDGLMLWRQRDCLMPTRYLLLVMRPGYMWISLSAQTLVEQIVARRCYEFYKSAPNFLIIFLPLSASSQRSYLLNCFDWLVLFGLILNTAFVGMAHALSEDL